MVKKYIPVLALLLWPLFILNAQQEHAPFTEGRWQANVSYTDAEGELRLDQYEIIFVKNNTCIVTVRSKENGVELYQDGDGVWSYDDDFLRIECGFPRAAISRLPGIDWVSVYQFDLNLSRFTLLVPPYPGAERNVRVSFVQTKDE
jgi:hypothetical protein